MKQNPCKVKPGPELTRKAPKLNCFDVVQTEFDLDTLKLTYRDDPYSVYGRLRLE